MKLLALLYFQWNEIAFYNTNLKNVQNAGCSIGEAHTNWLSKLTQATKSAVSLCKLWISLARTLTHPHLFSLTLISVLLHPSRCWVQNKCLTNGRPMVLSVNDGSHARDTRVLGLFPLPLRGKRECGNVGMSIIGIRVDLESLFSLGQVKKRPFPNHAVSTTYHKKLPLLE